MKSYNISSKILVCLLITCVICGSSCRRKAPQPSDVNRPAPAPDINQVAQEPTPIKVEDTEMGPNSIAVTVNGVKITEGQIDKIIAPQIEAIAKREPNHPPQFTAQLRKLLREQAIERIITEQLLDEKFKQANIVISDQEVVDQLKEIALLQSPPLSLEAFKEKVEATGFSFGELKQQVQTELAFGKLMESQFAEQVKVTEQEARKYYDENPKQFEVPEQVRASHILIKVEPDSSDEEKAKAKAKAEDLLNQIKNGADFAELAKANSACPSAANGGDLGLFTRGRMVAPFENAAFALKVDQVSDVVETEYGYHIIKVTAHQDPGVKDFEQLKEDIITQLMRRKQRDVATQYIDTLKAQANIVYPPGKEPDSSPPTPLPQGGVP